MAVNNGDSGRVRSTADEQVLEAIFNPEQPAGGGIEVRWHKTKSQCQLPPTFLVRRKK